MERLLRPGFGICRSYFNKAGPREMAGNATEERAQPKESVLTGWFRHRAEKFLSTSVIPLRLRIGRSAVDQ